MTRERLRALPYPLDLDPMALRGSRAFEALPSLSERGDADSKCLASLLCQKVPLNTLSEENECVCKAMLIRFCLSSICTDFIALNYEAMLRLLPKLCHHTACAFLDCRQYKQI